MGSPIGGSLWLSVSVLGTSLCFAVSGKEGEKVHTFGGGCKSLKGGWIYLARPLSLVVIFWRPIFPCCCLLLLFAIIVNHYCYISPKNFIYKHSNIIVLTTYSNLGLHFITFAARRQCSDKGSNPSTLFAGNAVLSLIKADFG